MDLREVLWVLNILVYAMIPVLLASIFVYFADDPKVTLSHQVPLSSGYWKVLKKAWKERMNWKEGLALTLIMAFGYPGLWLSRERKRRRILNDLMHN